jgi:hypothetical protein
MQRPSSSVPIHLAAVLVLAVLTAADLAAPAIAQGEGAESRFTTIDLVYVGEESCATISPDPAEIEVGQGVEWVLTGEGQVGKYSMRMIGKNAPGNDDRGLGPQTRIPCGKDSGRSGISNKPGTWVYAVEVYACPEKGQVAPDAEPICVVDPSVVVQGPPGSGT